MTTRKKRKSPVSPDVVTLKFEKLPDGYTFRQVGGSVLLCLDAVDDLWEFSSYVEYVRSLDIHISKAVQRGYGWHRMGIWRFKYFDNTGSDDGWEIKLPDGAQLLPHAIGRWFDQLFSKASPTKTRVTTQGDMREVREHHNLYCKVEYDEYGDPK